MSAVIDVFPAIALTTHEDPGAVLMKTGAACLGMTIAEARFVSQRLARAADDAEARVDHYRRLRQERDDARPARSYEQQMEDDAGYHGDRR
jgi:hypothetical protein